METVKLIVLENFSLYSSTVYIVHMQCNDTMLSNSISGWDNANSLDGVTTK